MEPMPSSKEKESAFSIPNQSNKPFQHTPINYGQSFKEHKLYIGITNLIRNELGVWEEVPCIITSDRKCIERPWESGPDFGFRLRKPPVKVEPRWSAAALTQFLSGSKSYSLADAFSDTQALVFTHCHFEDNRWADVTALLILLSYCHQCYPAFPYLQINGLRESGKTTLMEIIAALSFNGILTSSASPSFVFRYVDSLQASICIDELEGLDDTSDADGVMQRILNSGYKYSGTVTRASVGKKEGSWEPETFRAYSFKSFAGIEELPPTLASRCISITMLRSADANYSDREFKPDDIEVQETRDKLYSAVMSNVNDLYSSYRNIKVAGLKNRNLQLWRPLISAAYLIDAAIGKNIEAFAIELETDKESLYSDREALIILIGLLEYLRKANEPIQFIPIATLKLILAEHDNENFGFLKAGKDDVGASKWITRKLRQCGVVKTAARSGKLGGGGHSVRGHDIDRRIVEDRIKAYRGDVTSVTIVTEPEESTVKDTKITENTVWDVFKKANPEDVSQAKLFESDPGPSDEND